MFDIYKDSFISVEYSKLDNNLKNLTYKLDFNKMILDKVMREYLIQELSIDEIKYQLLNYAKNAKVTNSRDKENRKYTIKILNYIFRK